MRTEFCVAIPQESQQQIGELVWRGPHYAKGKSMGKKVTGGLITIALVVGIVSVAPAIATEGPLVTEGPGELITRPVAPGEIGAATNGAVSPNTSCSAGQVCAWSGYFAGNFSLWAASETGCHNHASNTPLHSGYNGTNHNERVGGKGEVAKYSVWESAEPVYGELCW